MKNKRFRSPIRPLIYSVASALSLISMQAHAQFAEVPLYLQNETASSGKLEVKHNIMLFIDDSGSMTSWKNPKTGGLAFPNSRWPHTRLQVVKDALTGVLDQYKDKFNWGLQTLHNNGKQDFAAFTDNWQEMKTRVEGVAALNGTPTTRRYFEIIDNIVIPNTRYRCQKNYMVVLSDGDANLSCNDRYPQYHNFTYNDGEYFSDYYKANKSTSQMHSYFGLRTGTNVCRFVSGGSVHEFWDENNGLGFFSKTLSTKDFKVGGLDAAGKSWDGDANDPADFSKQLVQTFTVGFGDSLSDGGKRYLTNGASKPEYFFNATSQEDLNAAFSTITDSISNDSQNQAIETTGTVAPAVTSSGISGLAATVQLDTGSWSSRLQFFGINKATGKVDASVSKYPSFNNRKTMINTDGKNTYFAESWAGNTRGTVADAYFGFTKSGEAKDALIPWVIRTGNDSNIASRYTTANGYSQNYRIRAPISPADKEVRNMGDIIDSPVLTIGGNAKDGLIGGRSEFLVTAANDGMVHLFKSAAAADAQNPYDLKLSYIPAAMERNMGGTAGAGGNTLAHALKDTAHTDYGKASHPHRYLINGGIVVRRTAADDKAKGQQAFMFGALGQGGRGAYALNIGGKHRGTGDAVGLDAADSIWQTRVPLFETAKNTEKDQTLNTLGFTVGTPQIGRIALKRKTDNTVDIAKDTRYAGFLANGYGMEKGKSTETALYVYDMLGQNADSGATEGATAGTLIQKLEVAGNTSGLSSPTLVDADFDGLVDVAYAGDYGGNMYRFDMRAASPTAWKVIKIFSGSASRPITAAPAISRLSANKYVVIFGTGSDVYQEDIKDKTQQAVYGIFDNLAETPSAATESDLQGQTLELETANGNSYRKITDTKAVTGNKKGWVVNLGATDGERVVVKPTMILRTAIISTRIYDQKVEEKIEANDPCTIDSHKTETKTSSWILALNAETGGQVSKRDAHLKFIRTDSPNQAYYAGQLRTGITSFTYMDAGKLNDSPVSKDGDSGGSGTDQAFKAANTEVPNNKCFSRNSLRVLLTNDKNSIEIGGRICGIRRLSWREIFF